MGVRVACAGPQHSLAQSEDLIARQLESSQLPPWPLREFASLGTWQEEEGGRFRNPIEASRPGVWMGRPALHLQMTLQ